MTTERIPGGWITWGNPTSNDNWAKAAFDSTSQAQADYTYTWWRMKTALWSQAFPPRSAMTLIGVDLGQEIRD